MNVGAGGNSLGFTGKASQILSFLFPFLNLTFITTGVSNFTFEASLGQIYHVAVSDAAGVTGATAFTLQAPVVEAALTDVFTSSTKALLIHAALDRQKLLLKTSNDGVSWQNLRTAIARREVQHRSSSNQDRNPTDLIIAQWWSTTVLNRPGRTLSRFRLHTTDFGFSSSFALSTYSREHFRLDRRCPTPCVRIGSKERPMIMTNQQMELGFGNSRVCPSSKRRQRRSSRANWWFERMREVVDQALDWRPAPPARPEQIYFPE